MQCAGNNCCSYSPLWKLFSKIPSLMKIRAVPWVYGAHLTYLFTSAFSIRILTATLTSLWKSCASLAWALPLLEPLSYRKRIFNQGAIWRDRDRAEKVEEKGWWLASLLRGSSRWGLRTVLEESLEGRQLFKDGNLCAIGGKGKVGHRETYTALAVARPRAVPDRTKHRTSCCNRKSSKQFV